MNIAKHFVAAHVKILEGKGFCVNTSKHFSDLTILFLNHPFTNLDRDLFEDDEIDNVPDPTFTNDKCKMCEEKKDEKHVPDLMDSSDFENVSGKNSFWVFFNKLFW